jgi:hypothetical protein
VLTLGTPQDVTLQELRVEMFMPADEGSEALLAKTGALTLARCVCARTDNGRFRVTRTPPVGASSLLFGFVSNLAELRSFPSFGAGSAYLCASPRAVLNMKEDALGLLAVSRCGSFSSSITCERLAAHGLTLL